MAMAQTILTNVIVPLMLYKLPLPHLLSFDRATLQLTLILAHHAHESAPRWRATAG